MVRVGSNTDEMKTILDALKGEYGTLAMSNGMNVGKAGRLVLLWGAFSAGADAVEIPKIPARFPLLFSGDPGTRVVLAEPGTGFVRVPELFRKVRFVAMGFALLND